MDRVSHIEKLVSGTQWENWKFQIQLALAGAQVIDVVDGSLTRDEHNEAEFKRADNKARAIIGTTVGGAQIDHIRHCMSAKEMWDALVMVHEAKDEISRARYYARYWNFKVGPGEGIIAAISRLNGIVAELAHHDEKIDERNKIARLIDSLPNEYASFCSAWDSTPAAERTYANLTQRLHVEEERRELGCEAKVVESEALFGRSKGCNCKCTCDKKANGLRAVGSINKNRSGNREKVDQGHKDGHKMKCFGCGNRGHFKANCPERNKQSSEWYSEALSSSSDAGRNTAWVMDSGASEHMSSERESFSLLSAEQFQCALPFPKRENRATAIGHVVHADVCGPNCVDYEPEVPVKLIEKITRLQMENTDLRDRNDELCAELDGLVGELTVIKRRKTVVVSTGNGGSQLSETTTTGAGESSEECLANGGAAAAAVSQATKRRGDSPSKSKVAGESPRLGKLRKCSSSSGDGGDDNQEMEVPLHAELEGSSNGRVLRRGEDEEEVADLKARVIELETLLKGRPKEDGSGDRVEATAAKESLEEFIDADGPRAMVSVGDTEPVNYREAISGPESAQWKEAMQEEMDSLLNNGTWSLVHDSNQKLTDCRWVFKKKVNVDGVVVRYKARLVARGFIQVYGVDYTETFSPVMRLQSFRMMMAVAAAKQLKMKFFDVTTAFLNGELEERVVMKQPEGFSDGSGRVCLLRRSLYGLKQAPRYWNKKFTDVISKFGLAQSKNDPCVFVRRGKGSDHPTLVVGIYVDDGIILAEDEEEIEQLLVHLKEEFSMKVHDGDQFLGMEIKRHEDGHISIGQRGYAERMVARYKMEDSFPVSTPIDHNRSLCSLSNSSEIKFPYRSAVGSLNYLAVTTRPDISFAVGVAGRHLEDPSAADVKGAKRILSYVKGTAKMLMTFPGGKIELIGYSDSDYAGDTTDRRSTSGGVFLVAGAPVSWHSRRQR